MRIFFPYFGLSVLWILFIVVFIIVSRLCLAFCVYSDAKYRRDENAVLWGTLSGFIPLAALIYIIIKISSNHSIRRCTQCGEMIAPNGQFCPRCGKKQETPSPEELRKYGGRRKLFFVLWIGSLILIIVAVAIIIIIGIGMSTTLYHSRF